MARILRGVKSPFASSAGGGWVFFPFPVPVGLVWACGVPVSIPAAVSLAPLLPACGVPWGIFDYGHS